MRQNPYNKKDKDSYLINPNTGKPIWWHFTTTEGFTDFNMKDFETDSEYEFTSNETYFAGSLKIFEDESFAERFKGVFELKIKLGDHCSIFDARDLFSEVPKWVMSDIERVFNYYRKGLHDDPWYEVFFEEIGISESVETIHPLTYEYLRFGDLGDCLNAWRETIKHKNGYYLYVFNNHDYFNKDERDDLEVEFLIQLWLLDFGFVQTVLTHPNIFPIHNNSLVEGCIGWLERERTEFFSPTSNPINLALFHSSENSIVPYLDKSCLPETSIEILSFEHFLDESKSFMRQNPQKQPIYVNNLGIHINTPITLYHASVNAENILKFGYLTKEELYETYKKEAVMGLGGGSGLAMTGDPRYAVAIAVYFGMTFRLAIRDITALEVIEQFALAAPKTFSEWKSEPLYTGAGNLCLADAMPLLELAAQGKWCIKSKRLSGELDYSTSGDPRFVDSESKFKRTYIVDLDQCTDHNGNPNPYKDIEFFYMILNGLLFQASSNEELTYFAPFNSNLYKAFVGKDFSELNNLCVVTSKLKPGTILYPNSDSYFKSIFDYNTTFRTFFVSNLSDFELVGSRYRPFEEPYKIIKSEFSYPQPPEVKPEVNLEFEIDTDAVEYLTPDLKKKMVGFLPAEDEFRLHHPKEGLTPPKEFACADAIFEHLEQVWGTSEIDCFYPWFEIKTLEENLSED